MEKQTDRNFMNLIKNKHKAWTPEWTKPCSRIGWGQLRKSSSVKRSWGPGGHQVGHEASVPLSSKEATASYVAQTRVLPAHLGKDPAALSRTCERHLSAVPSLRFPHTGQTLMYWRKS